MRSFQVLLARARRGDEDAVAELYTAYGATVTKRIRTRLPRELRRHYDTQDLWQSVFVEVLRELPAFEDRGEEAFRHWLLLKGTRKVHAKLRRHLGARGARRAVTPPAGLEQEVPSRDPRPSEELERREAAAAIRRALGRLAATDRDVVALRMQQGLEFRAIAERLGLASAEAARKRYARALVVLRGQLD